MTTYVDGRAVSKRCCVCKEEKEVVYFSKASASSDGYQSKCKSCASVLAQRRNLVRPGLESIWHPRRKTKFCPVCYGLAHRVRGHQCTGCGLQKGLPT